MIPGRDLPRMGQLQGTGVLIETCQKRERRGSSIWPHPGRHDHAWVPRKIGCQKKVRRKRGGHKHIHLLKQVLHRLHKERSDPIGLDVLNRWNEARGSESVRPRSRSLRNQEGIPPGPGQFIEGCCRLGGEDHPKACQWQMIG